MIELKHLRTLFTLRETGSLSATARQVHLSVSALSHQLAELESRLGGPLYLRKSRPLRFTREGEWLLELAEHCLPRVDAVMSRFTRRDMPVATPLRLAIECHSCIHWLAPALTGCSATEGREIEFVTGHSFDPQSALLLGELDLVLTSDVQPCADIYYSPLFDYDMRLVLAPEHPLAVVETITPELLAAETLLSYPVASSRLDVVRQFLQPAQLVPKRIRQADNTLMLVQMAAAGWGVTVLPSWVSREFEAQGLVVSRSIGAGLRSRLFGALRARERDEPGYRELFRQIRLTAAQQL
jgi:LysR family transcriptional regulator, regulator for metE and metH